MAQTVVAPANVIVEDYADEPPRKKSRKDVRKLGKQLSERGLISAKAARRHLRYSVVDTTSH